MGLKIKGRFAKLNTRVISASTGGEAPATPEFTGTLLHTITNPNAYSTSAGDQFGFSVAISGDRAVVGARFEDDAGGSSSGAAYIFDVVTGNLLHTLTNPNAYSTSADDNFGTSVAISGDRVIVGAQGEDDPSGSGSDSGKAYIFDVVSGNLLYTLDNPNTYGTAANDYFGWSVSISDNYVVVGAYSESDAEGTAADSGAVYVFDVSTGNLLHSFVNPNPYGVSYDQFGWSVAVSGNSIIVGARRADSIGTIDNNSGAAYIYN